MRSEVTAEVLEKVAKLLGGDYCVNNGKLCTIEDSRYRWAYLDVSDGDLLLAILNKAAEMGCGYKLSHPEGSDRAFEMRLTKPAYVAVSAVGSTPLEAAILAFAKLPEPCGYEPDSGDEP